MNKTQMWKDPRCKYTETIVDDIKHVEGCYTNGIAYSQFRLNQQTCGEYKIRGRISIRRSGRTGVLYRTDELGNRKPIAADIRLKSDDTDIIKDEIVKKFNQLYADNYDIIYKDMKRTRVDDLTLTGALFAFGREFLVAEKKVKKSKSMEKSETAELEILADYVDYTTKEDE